MNGDNIITNQILIERSVKRLVEDDSTMRYLVGQLDLKISTDKTKEAADLVQTLQTLILQMDCNIHTLQELL